MKKIRIRDEGVLIIGTESLFLKWGPDGLIEVSRLTKKEAVQLTERVSRRDDFGEMTL